MREAGFAVTTLILGSLFTFATGLTATPAEAVTHHIRHVSAHRGHTVVHYVRHARPEHEWHPRKVVFHSKYHAKPHVIAYSKYHASSKYHARVRHFIHTAGISCVPFARRDSGIDVSGNAWQWWGHAAGIYARGDVPQPGSVLTFRANPHMPLGHVAVVTKVINRREIEVDHANWTHGMISRDVPVVDVSEANDWTAVRVEERSSGDFGSVYPTYGFIYDRADTGRMVAQAHAPAPQPVLNPAPSDLRPAAERPWETYEEVAEAPSGPRQHVGVQREAMRQR